MFVDRTNGAVTGLFAARQYAGQEELPDDHADVAAFREARSSFPVVASRLRLKLELAERGLLAGVTAAVNAGGTLPQMYWAEAAVFESNHPLVAQIGAAIGLNDQQITALFKAAASRDA
jgi:hypothetical protein